MLIVQVVVWGERDTKILAPPCHHGMM